MCMTAIPIAPILLLTTVALAGPLQSAEASSADVLRAEVNSLQVEEVAWRKIDWKTCLIDGFNTSRKLNKPVILWVFIDRPVDDRRC